MVTTIERARSARSSCQACGEKIAQAGWRFGLGRGRSFRWWHLRCAVAEADLQAELADVSGFSEAAREALRALSTDPPIEAAPPSVRAEPPTHAEALLPADAVVELTIVPALRRFFVWLRKSQHIQLLELTAPPPKAAPAVELPRQLRALYSVFDGLRLRWCFRGKSLGSAALLIPPAAEARFDGPWLRVDGPHGGASVGYLRRGAETQLVYRDRAEEGRFYVLDPDLQSYLQRGLRSGFALGWQRGSPAADETRQWLAPLG